MIKIKENLKNIVLATALVSNIALAKELDYDIETEKAKKKVEILNVSYDPTRELYEEYNKSFSFQSSQFLQSFVINLLEESRVDFG